MFEITDYKKTIDSVLKDVPERTQDILSRRFGIGKREKFPQRETLESIGKNYGITRERVRQIEKKGIETLQHSSKFSKLKEPFFEVKYFIDENGGLKREDLLESYLAPQEEYLPYLLFLLELGDMFSYRYDTPHFYSFWKTREEVEEIAKEINDFVIKILEKRKKLFEKEEILEMGKRGGQEVLNKELKENHVLSYIEVSKEIEENPFGEYGLFSWPEVNPKGVRQKAYLVLKKEGKPLHFKELAEIIEDKLQSPVQASTLHNELIKDQNFVLVGRGIYALKDWGYKEGTVRDIIEDALRDGRKLSRQEIIKKVKEQRMVKESTIILNLHYFKKTKEGKYII